MPAILSPSAKQQFFTNAGVPAAGYKLYTYAANSFDPLATYLDRAATTENQNPITLDARGEAVIFLQPGLAYDYVYTSDADATIYTVEDVIADAGDANSVTFTAEGDGAVTRSMQSKLSEFISVKDYGALGNGVADDSNAFQKAIAQALEGGFGGVRVPAGIYSIGSAVTVSLLDQGGFSLVGDGPDLTEIRVTGASGNGLAITSGTGNWWLNVAPHNPVVLRDFTLSTTKTNIGTGISLNMGSVEGRPAPPIILERISIRAHNGFGFYFANGIDLLDASNVHAHSVAITQGGPGNTNGVGVDIRASGATTDPTCIKFTACEVVYGQYGWRIGDYVEGVYLTQCDAINTVSKVYHHTTTGESGLHVIGGHANCSGPCYDIDGVFDHTIANVLMYSSAGSAAWRGIKVRNSGSATYTGNIMRAGAVAGEIGIDIDSVPNEALHGYTISGNHFSNIDSAGVLGVNARKVRWSNDNQYLNCPNRIQNLAPTANANYVEGYRFEGTVIVTLAGGSPSELVDITLPAGRFLTKPSCGLLSSATQQAVGFYDYDSGISTASNARCMLRKADGTNLGAGPTRVSVVFAE